MKITVDTNVLIRAAVGDDEIQAMAADRILESAEVIAVTVSYTHLDVYKRQVPCLLFPVPCLVHRWHVSQLVSSFGGRIWYCAVR